MILIKVVAMFDDRTLLEHAKEELIRSNLATADSAWAEPELIDEAAERPSSSRTGWERLRDFFDTEADHDVSAYAEGVRRGSVLLVVETPSERAEEIKDVLRRSGAIDLRRRVNRWITTGWQTFDPTAPSFTELEILDERRACFSDTEIAADDNSKDGPERSVALFDEATEQLLGRISEAEFSVLHDSLEQEGPDDDDDWINDEEIAGIASRPGATPHLVALLRRAVGDNTNGVDIRFERDSEMQPDFASAPADRIG